MTKRIRGLVNFRRTVTLLEQVIELAGFGLIAWAGWEITEWLGLALAGATLLIIANRPRGK